MAIEANDELPENEKTFSIDVAKGDVTGSRHKGKFKCVCVPNLKQRAQADLARARLNGPLPASLSEETRTYHFVISELQARIKKAPGWFTESGDGESLLDLNVLIAIFNEAMKAEMEWREAVWGPVKKASTIESSDDEDDEAKDEEAKDKADVAAG